MNTNNTTSNSITDTIKDLRANASKRFNSSDRLGMDNAPDISNKIKLAQFAYDTAEEVYQSYPDPREEVSKKFFIDAMKQNGCNLSDEVLNNTYKGIIKNITGQDMDATGFFELFGQKVTAGYDDLISGVREIGYNLEDLFTDSNESDVDKYNRKQEQNASQENAFYSKGLKRRTDYFSEYEDTFIERAILGVGELIPSLSMSLPSMAGAFLFGVPATATTAAVSGLLGQVDTGYKILKTISDVLNFTMELGGTVKSLREAGATPQQVFIAGNTYAGISTLIEHYFDKVPEKFISAPAGEALNNFFHGKPKNVFNKVSEAILNKFVIAGTDWVAQTGEEVLQTVAEDLVTNVLSDYRAEKGLTDLEIKKTAKQVGEDALATFKSMGTSQTLLSVASALTGIGFSANFGSIKQITNVNKHFNKTANSKIEFAGNIFGINNPTDADKKNVFDFKKDGKLDPLKVFEINGKLYADKENRAKAQKLVNEDLQATAYVERVENGDMNNAEMNPKNRSVKEMAYINGGETFIIKEDGTIAVSKESDIDNVVGTLINKYSDSFVGAKEIANGVELVFEEDGNKRKYDIVYEQDAKGDSVTDLYGDMSEEERKANKEAKEKAAKVEEDRKKQEDIIKQAEAVQKRTTRKKMQQAYDTAIAEANKNNSEEVKASNNSYAKEFNKKMFDTYLNAKKGFRKQLSNKEAQSFANATTVVATRLANALGISLSDFMKDTNFEIAELASDYGLYSPNTNTIILSNIVDGTTAIHEIGHAFFNKVADISTIKGFKETYYDTLKGENQNIGKDETQWTAGEDTQEAFMADLENYIQNNVVKNESLREVFEQLKSALRTLRKDLDFALSDDAKNLIDNLLGLNEDNGTIEVKDEFEQEDNGSGQYVLFHSRVKPLVGKSSNYEKGIISQDNIDKWTDELEYENGSVLSQDLLEKLHAKLYKEENGEKIDEDDIDANEGFDYIMERLNNVDGVKDDIEMSLDPNNLVESYFKTISQHLTDLKKACKGETTDEKIDDILSNSIALLYLKKFEQYVKNDEKSFTRLTAEEISDLIDDISDDNEIDDDNFIDELSDELWNIGDRDEQTLMAWTLDKVQGKIDAKLVADYSIKETDSPAVKEMKEVQQKLAEVHDKAVNKVNKKTKKKKSETKSEKALKKSKELERLALTREEKEKIELDRYNNNKIEKSDKEKDVTNRLNNGGFVTETEKNVYGDEAWMQRIVKTEDSVAKVYSTDRKIAELAESSINAYLKDKGIARENLTAEDWKKIADNWNKKLTKEIGGSAYMFNDIFYGIEPEYVLKRFDAYLNTDANSYEKKVENWKKRFEGDGNNFAFKDFLTKFYKNTDYLDNGVITAGNFNPSSNFPFTELVIHKLVSKDRIDIGLLRKAKQEVANNAEFFRKEEMLWEGRTEEFDAEDIEADIKFEGVKNLEEYLNDEEVSQEIKDKIIDGSFTLEYVNAIEKQNYEYRRKLEIAQQEYSDLVELHNELSWKDTKLVEEIEKEKVTLEKKIAQYNEKIKKAKDAEAAANMKIKLFKKRRDVARYAKQKTGDIDTQYALRKLFTAINSGDPKRLIYSVNMTPEFLNAYARTTYHYLLETDILDKDNLPTGKTLVDENGKPNKPFYEYTDRELDGYISAMVFDSESARFAKEQSVQKKQKKLRDIGYKITAELKNVNSEVGKNEFGEDELEIKLTNTQERDIRNAVFGTKEYQKLQYDLEKGKIQEPEFDFKFQEMVEKTRQEYIANQIVNNPDVYGDKNKLSKFWNNSLLNGYATTPSRLFRRIGETFYKTFFGDGSDNYYGLNDYYERKYRDTKDRLDRFNDSVVEIFGIKAKTEEEKLKKIADTLSSLNKGEFVIDESTKGFQTYNTNKNGDKTKDQINAELEDILDSYDEVQRKTVMSMYNGEQTKHYVNNNKFSYEELMGIYIRTLNNNGLSHIHYGNGLSIKQLQTVRDMFQTKEFEKYRLLAESMVSIMGEKWQDVAKVAKEVDNTKLIIQPNYFPNTTEKTKDIIEQSKIDYVANNTLNKSFINTANGGHTAVNLDVVTSFAYNIDAQEAYIHGREMFHNFHELLTGKENLKGKISAIYGKKIAERIDDFVKINEARPTDDLKELGKIVSNIRGNYAMAKLAWNFSPIGQQPSSIFLGLSKYSAKELAISLKNVMNKEDRERLVYSHSEQMRKRSINEISYISEMDEANNKVTKGIKRFAELGMKGMKTVDEVVACALWDCAYRDNRAKMMTESEASINATQWVMDIQSSGNVKDRSLLYSSRDPLIKLCTLFTEQLNKQFNMITDAIYEKNAKALFKTFSSMALSMLWVSLVTGKVIPDEPDDATFLDWIKSITEALFSESLGLIPFAGSTLKGISEGYSYSGNSGMLTDVVLKTGNLVKTLASDSENKEKKVKTATKNLALSGMDYTGLPSVELKRLMQCINLLSEGHSIDSVLPLLGTDWKELAER